MDSIRQILDPRVLTASYAQRPQLRSYLLTDRFYVNPEEIPGDSYQLFWDPAENRPAPLNVGGAPARVLDGAGAEERKATLFTAFNKMPLNGVCLQALREPDSEGLQKMGRTEISRQQTKFAERHRLMKEVTIAKIISDGEVHLSAAGTVLETSSGAAVTCDFNVPASRKNQADTGSGDLWALTLTNASADVQAYFDAIDDAAEAAGCEAPTEVLCHPLMKGVLRNLTDFQTWAAGSMKDSEALLRGSFIEGLFGKNWTFYGGKYQASDGTMKDFVPYGKLIMHPPTSGPWLKASVGSTLIPKFTGIVTDPMAALAQSVEAYGPFSYAKLLDDPWQLWMYMGDVFGLHFNDPNSIWMIDAIFS